ncbi:MAG: tripartite tricarboxylate transporter TctB family protein [Rhizobiaceae bacterium]|nr:tripartite tricarboxylate transporter TctB family protein [Rhizobiaceae bacterium]
MISRDVAGGFLMMAVGFAFSYFGWAYDVGTLSQMGPGFMPVVLGGVLALLGLLILVNGVGASGITVDMAAWPDWRGLIAIIAGMVAFVLLATRAGLIVSTFAVVFISALGDRGNRLRDALLLGVGVTIFGVVVFYYGLQIRLPLLPGFLQ